MSNVRSLVASAAKFKVLPGLPGTGPLPLHFSHGGLGEHSEGYVVEFATDSGQSWVGNFQRGISSLYTVFGEPATSDITVIAGGQAYVVVPAAGRLKRKYGGGIETALPLPDLNAVLVSDCLRFELYRGAEQLWRTRRLSWDGIRNVTVEAFRIAGEGWRYDETWHPFEVELCTGAAKGGGYDGPET